MCIQILMSGKNQEVDFAAVKINRYHTQRLRSIQNIDSTVGTRCLKYFFDGQYQPCHIADMVQYHHIWVFQGKHILHCLPVQFLCRSVKGQQFYSEPVLLLQSVKWSDNSIMFKRRNIYYRFGRIGQTEKNLIHSDGGGWREYHIVFTVDSNKCGKLFPCICDHIRRRFSGFILPSARIHGIASLKFIDSLIHTFRLWKGRCRIIKIYSVHS